MRPVEPQDAARLLVVHSDGRLEDASVRDLPTYLSAGDVMVFNDTRVLPAALKGVRPARDETGNDVDVDVNLVGRQSDRTWRALARPGKRLKAGDLIAFGHDLSATLLEKLEDGEVVLEFSKSGAALDAAIDAADGASVTAAVRESTGAGIVRNSVSAMYFATCSAVGLIESNGSTSFRFWL